MMSFFSDKLDSKKGYMEMVENFYLGIHRSAPDESLLYYSQNFIVTQDIYLGVLAKNMLKTFLDQGDISQKQYKEFHDAVNYYFKSSLEYIQKRFPLD